MADQAANVIVGFSGTIAVICAILWAFVAFFLARARPSGSRRRAAVLSVYLVLPLFVVLEVWGVALSLGRTWAPLPWVIAGGGALSAALIVPRMAAVTRRLTPALRRRGLTNAVFVIAACTAIAELFVFMDRTWFTWILGIFSLAASIGSVLTRARSARSRKTTVE